MVLLIIGMSDEFLTTDISVVALPPSIDAVANVVFKERELLMRIVELLRGITVTRVPLTLLLKTAVVFDMDEIEPRVTASVVRTVVIGKELVLDGNEANPVDSNDGRVRFSNISTVDLVALIMGNGIVESLLVIFRGSGKGVVNTVILPDEVLRMVTFNTDMGPDMVVLMRIDTFDGRVLFPIREPFNVVNPVGTVGVVRLPTTSDEPVVLKLNDGVVRFLVMIGPFELLGRKVVLGINDALDLVVLISIIFVVLPTRG